MPLYSYKGARPTQLPNRLKFEDGSTKTDRTTFTAEDISSAGWIEVEDPPTVSYPNKLEWDGESWVVREPNSSEIAVKWQEIRNECKLRLAETDYKIIKALESGQELNPVVTQYRQELRDLHNNVNDIDVWNVAYPTLSLSKEE